MKTEKLTLRLEEESINRAKRIAAERGTSVSKMVAGFFESIEDPQDPKDSQVTVEDSELGEITRRLRGSISTTEPTKRAGGKEEQDEQSTDEQDYRRYLERKYD